MLKPEKQRILDDVAGKLIRDYEYLLSRSLTLSEQCIRAILVVMNNTMIKESCDAMSQAEGVVKLMSCCYLCIALFHCVLLLGMNFAQFGQGGLSIWIWVAVSHLSLY